LVKNQHKTGFRRTEAPFFTPGLLAVLLVISPSFLDGSVAMAFLVVSWGGAAAVLMREWIFLHVLVRRGRGVAGPKELMGLVGAVTDRRAYSPPTPRSVEVEA
jgi:hypothetical protein